MEKTISLFSREKYLDAYGESFRVLYFRQHREFLHYHDFHELVIVLSGSGAHITQNQRYPIAAGDVFVIKPGAIHAYAEAKNLTLANVMFNRDALNFNRGDLADVPGYFVLFEVSDADDAAGREFKVKHTLTRDQLSVANNLLDRIVMEKERREPGCRFAALTLFQELIIHLARSYENDERRYSRRTLQLGKMLKFIEENYMRDISRADIFAAANVSTSVGNRIFRELLHETPIARLSRQRINQALELLRSGKYSVSEVAFRSGFRDSNYFSARFHRLTGYPPRQMASAPALPLAPGAPGTDGASENRR